MPSSPVVLGGTARIVAHGAAAKPFAYVACRPGDYAFLTLSISEVSGKGIASGKGNTQVNCNGQIQTITIPVAAHGKAFVKGTGYARATLYLCGTSFCGNTKVSGNVKLKEKK